MRCNPVIFWKGNSSIIVNFLYRHKVAFYSKLFQGIDVIIVLISKIEINYLCISLKPKTKCNIIWPWHFYEKGKKLESRFKICQEDPWKMMSRWMEKKSLYILSAGTYKVFINFTSYSAFLFKKKPLEKDSISILSILYTLLFNRTSWKYWSFKGEWRNTIIRKAHMKKMTFFGEVVHITVVFES